MLPNHAPLVVAEQFGTLEALHPGRIDLGIGRAPGTDQYTALRAAAHHGRAVGRGLPPGAGRPDRAVQRPLAEGLRAPITATPGRGDMPAIWLLGSSGFSAQLAGLLGLPFAFAHHFSAANTVPALALYRQNFRPSRGAGPAATRWSPQRVICADTDERARWLSGPAALSFLRLRPGLPAPLASPGGSGRLSVCRARAGVRPGSAGDPDHRRARDRPPRPGRPADGDRRRRADADHHGLRPGRPAALLRAGRRPGPHPEHRGSAHRAERPPMPQAAATVRPRRAEPIAPQPPSVPGGRADRTAATVRPRRPSRSHRSHRPSPAAEPIDRPDGPLVPLNDPGHRARTPRPPEDACGFTTRLVCILRRQRSTRRSARICPTTLRPGMPVTPPPPWVADPAWYRPRTGVRRSA